jgi:hypothetical protein
VGDVEEKNNVPYIVYEGEQARNERHIKRLVIALVLAIMLIFASNLIWLYAWMQYDYSSEEITHTIDVDAKDGIANYIGNDGDIVNGADNGYDNNKTKNENKESE